MPDEPVQLIPADRFEWERIVRRANLSVGAQGTALVLATYGNVRGADIWPGQERLAKVRRVTVRQIRRHMDELEAYGLIQLVRVAARRSGKADHWRLTYPSDFLERPGILDPNEQVYRTPVSGETIHNQEMYETPVSGTGNLSTERAEVFNRTPQHVVADIRDAVPDTDVRPPEQLHQPTPDQSVSVHDVTHQRGPGNVDNRNSSAGSVYEPTNSVYAAWRRDRKAGAS